MVQTDVPPVGGRDPLLERPVWMVTDRQRDPAASQQVKYGPAKPARMAKLDRATPVGERIQPPRQAIVVARKCFGQLPQDRSEPAGLDHRRKRRVEAADASVQIGQAPHVREVAAGLYREHKLVGRVTDPPLDRAEAGQPIEGGVDLDGS